MTALCCTTSYTQDDGRVELAFDYRKQKMVFSGEEGAFVELPYPVKVWCGRGGVVGGVEALNLTLDAHDSPINTQRFTSQYATIHKSIRHNNAVLHRSALAITTATRGSPRKLR